MPGRQQLPTEEQVAGSVEIVGQRQRLVDGFDARRLGIVRGAEVHLLAVHLDRALVGDVDAAQHLDQHRLAGAVVPEHADAFAGVQVEIDVVDGDQAAEALHDLPHLDERRAIRRGRRRDRGEFRLHHRQVLFW